VSSPRKGAHSPVNGRPRVAAQTLCSIQLTKKLGFADRSVARTDLTRPLWRQGSHHDVFRKAPASGLLWRGTSRPCQADDGRVRACRAAHLGKDDSARGRFLELRCAALACHDARHARDLLFSGPGPHLPCKSRLEWPRRRWRSVHIATAARPRGPHAKPARIGLPADRLLGLDGGPPGERACGACRWPRAS